MLPTFEFAILHQFCRVLDKHFSGALKKREVVNRLARESTIPYIGLLGQLSAIREYQTGSFEQIIRAKLATTLAQLRIMSEPDVFIPQLVKQAKGQQINQGLLEELRSIDELTLDELQQRIEEISNKVIRVGNITTDRKSVV